METRRARAPSGFTLVEVVITLVIASLLGIAVVRFYKDSYRTYSLQEQIAERDLNAHYVVNKFVEVLQQAGSSLPDSGWTVLSLRDGGLLLGVNPRGVEEFITSNTASSHFIPVGDAALFRNSDNVLLNTTHVLVDYGDPAVRTRRLAIDTRYNSNGFSAGIKDNATGLDSIRVTNAVSLDVGDRVYGYREDHYLLDGSDLVIRPNRNAAEQMVLAENIDSLGFTFLDRRGRRTTAWRNMRSASITVRARTARPDPKLPPPGYRKISLPMNIILRNRI